MQETSRNGALRTKQNQNSSAPRPRGGLGLGSTPVPSRTSSTGRGGTTSPSRRPSSPASCPATSPGGRATPPGAGTAPASGRYGTSTRRRCGGRGEPAPVAPRPGPHVVLRTVRRGRRGPAQRDAVHVPGRGHRRRYDRGDDIRNRRGQERPDRALLRHGRGGPTELQGGQAQAAVHMHPGPGGGGAVTFGNLTRFLGLEVPSTFELDRGLEGPGSPTRWDTGAADGEHDGVDRGGKGRGEAQVDRDRRRRNVRRGGHRAPLPEDAVRGLRRGGSRARRGRVDVRRGRREVRGARPSRPAEARRRPIRVPEEQVRPPARLLPDRDEAGDRLRPRPVLQQGRRDGGRRRHGVRPARARRRPPRGGPRGRDGGVRARERPDHNIVVRGTEALQLPPYEPQLVRAQARGGKGRGRRRAREDRDEVPRPEGGGEPPPPVRHGRACGGPEVEGDRGRDRHGERGTLPAEQRGEVGGQAQEGEGEADEAD
ncbi:hypothetical protein THAOC_08702 [Thalassiosira oceanica]|uniref:Uncharacterized protein n=1 Tax=Thalassiosira oceanica TaxID=159749 RepID=K0THK5_THAOC|nr:hypothetical protein THAOC_08702 [Thalassiosira oceanica]|eukprot:EJK69982.1 hypothetical protein THAOC_08702 [Thalassiosira oceanica]